MARKLRLLLRAVTELWCLVHLESKCSPEQFDTWFGVVTGFLEEVNNNKYKCR